MIVKYKKRLTEMQANGREREQNGFLREMEATD